VNHCDLNLFADDTSMYVFSGDIDNLFFKCNASLNSLNSWFLANKLSLSLDKCVYTFFGHNKKNNQIISNYDLFIDGIKITKVAVAKYLGIFIDENLTWQEHIQYILNKLIKFCSLFYKLRAIIPNTTLKNLYFALVHPHLVYGVEIYANTYQKHLDPLIKLNNKILRILQNRKLNYPVQNLYTNYKTLPVPKLHSYFIIILMHKVRFNLKTLPIPFQNYFVINCQIHDHDTRQHNLVHVDRKRTNIGQRSIKFKGGQLWNSIPPSIKLYGGIQTFKKKLKLYLMYAVDM
jgi:hypothetical protein